MVDRNDVVEPTVDLVAGTGIVYNPPQVDQDLGPAVVHLKEMFLKQQRICLAMAEFYSGKYLAPLTFEEQQIIIRLEDIGYLKKSDQPERAGFFNEEALRG